MSALPRSVTIAGLGLMGGSLARALAALAEPPRMAFVDPNPQALTAVRAAPLHGATHASLDEALPADLLVLAMPISPIVDVLRRGGLDRYEVVTDLGSVKSAPYQAAVDGGLGDRYAGSHPMCGDHRSGFEAARADLYEGVRVYVMSEAPEPARAIVSALWAALGAVVQPITAADHDVLVARTSHLPQLVASSLAATLADESVDGAQLGPGGRDTTRIAASDPSLWVDILMHNRTAILHSLAHFDTQLHAIQRSIAAGDTDALRTLLAVARSWRSTTP